MIIRALLYLCLASGLYAHAALPALAQQSAPLPAAMLGVWASDMQACENKPGGIQDGRIGVKSGGVEFFASAWNVRVWQRYGEHFRGRAQVNEEGQARPLPGHSLISLHLISATRLEIRRHGGQQNEFIKCPDGTRLR